MSLQMEVKYQGESHWLIEVLYSGSNGVIGVITNPNTGDIRAVQLEFLKSITFDEMNQREIERQKLIDDALNPRKTLF